MHAERITLQTDHQGNLKEVPKLPPNKQIEAIFLVIADLSNPSGTKRVPHPDIAGKIKVHGDIIDSISEQDWFGRAT